ncbi:MAG: hypothetical protein EBU31_16045, partial [Proteobacteria bacterium]|nr:hypothetical protein [Pseudomonadota bacterium]
DPSWHPGLLGLAAARLVEKFNKPVMLFGGEDQWLKASGRAPAGLDLHACLDACAALLVKYGGHAAAAGGSIEPANMPAFIDAFEQAVAGHGGHRRAAHAAALRQGLSGTADPLPRPARARCKRAGCRSHAPEGARAVAGFSAQHRTAAVASGRSHRRVP